MVEYWFTVYGEPKPKGSMRAFVPKGWRRAVMTNDNKGTRSWEQAIVAALASMSIHTFSGPVSVTAAFYVTRAKRAPPGDVEPTRKRDLDKLARAMLDGLTKGGLLEDDGIVVQLTTTKIFAGSVLDPGGKPRAVVGVRDARRIAGRWPGTAL